VSNLIKNGDFTLPITSPSTGNTYTASNNATAGTVFNFNGGTFRSQSDYAGGSNGHRFDIRTGNYTNGSINQDPFPEIQQTVYLQQIHGCTTMEII
jgi:hypothetical protein